MVVLTNSVSDDKIQITILILRRGALSRWVVAKDKPKYDEIFNSLEQDKGKVTGEIKFDNFCYEKIFF